jgi:hypothetical protein
MNNLNPVSRRDMLASMGGGLGLAALATLTGAGRADSSGTVPGLADLPHHPARAKRVVVLWQGGGPSHVDLFDDKPVMRKMAGKDIPESVRGTTRLSTMSSGYAKWPCVPSIKRDATGSGKHRR